MKMLKLNKAAVAAVAILCFSTNAMSAPGLGDISINSYLNERLSADIAVDEFDTAMAQVITAHIVGDSHPLSIAVTQGTSGSLIHVESTAVLNSPVLEIEVSIKSPLYSQVKRFTVLSDPKDTVRTYHTMSVTPPTLAPILIGNLPFDGTLLPHRSHVVKRGDTLYSIAREYLGAVKIHTAVNMLSTANKANVPNPNRLKIGTHLVIPAVQAPSAAGQRAGRQGQKTILKRTGRRAAPSLAKKQDDALNAEIARLEKKIDGLKRTLDETKK